MCSLPALVMVYSHACEVFSNVSVFSECSYRFMFIIANTWQLSNSARWVGGGRLSSFCTWLLCIDSTNSTVGYGWSACCVPCSPAIGASVGHAKQTLKAPGTKSDADLQQDLVLL